MIILLEPSGVKASALADAMAGRSEAVSTITELRSAAEREDARTFVVGAGVATDVALDEAHRLRLHRPEVGVVLVRSRVDNAVLTGALRAGVREVVAEHDLAGICAAVDRSEQITSAMLDGEQTQTTVVPKRASITSVVAPKGGVGKTTLAVNLAVALAQRGRSVALLDLDLGFGDVPISLGLTADHHLGEAVDIAARLDAAAVQRLLTPHNSGVNVLASPSDPALADRIGTQLVERVLDLLAAEFDHVVVDTAPALEDRMLAAVERSERIVMPTTPDVAGIKNLKVGLDTLRLLGIDDERIDVVLNRAYSKVGIGQDEVAKLLRRPVSISVPSSRDVPVTANRGVPIVLDKPRSAVARAISEFAQTRLLDPTVEADGQALPDDVTRRWRRRRSA